MKREKLSERKLPDYTKGEEIFNMTTHIVGGTRIRSVKSQKIPFHGRRESISITVQPMSTVFYEIPSERI